MSLIRTLDIQLETLKKQRPGWRIWFVPHAVGGVTWCAVREPTLSADTPEQLSDLMGKAEKETEDKIKAGG